MNQSNQGSAAQERRQADQSSGEFFIRRYPRRFYGLTILPGESPTSWAYRAAIALKTSTNNFFATLIRMQVPEDFDRTNVTDLFRLAFVSNNRTDLLKSAFNPNLLPWVADLQNKHFPHAPRYQFCPKCLSEGQVPYLRLSWRLLSAVVCERHETPLTSRCHSCKRQPNLRYRPYPLRQASLGFCPSCSQSWSFPITPAVPLPLVRALLSFHRRFTQAFNSYNRRGSFTSSSGAFYNRFVYQDQMCRLKRIKWMDVLGDTLYKDFCLAFPHLVPPPWSEARI